MATQPQLYKQAVGVTEWKTLEMGCRLVLRVAWASGVEVEAVVGTSGCGKGLESP